MPGPRRGPREVAAGDEGQHGRPGEQAGAAEEDGAGAHGAAGYSRGYAPRRTQERWRHRAIPLRARALAFALALSSAPGDRSLDTKIDLHTRPGALPRRRRSRPGRPPARLGHVWAGSTRLPVPDGAVLRARPCAGAPDWLVHRLWLGRVLALAAWGIVRLLDALLPRAAGPPTSRRGRLMVLNPYRGRLRQPLDERHAGRLRALPWLLLAVHRGVARPRGVVVAGRGVRAGRHGQRGGVNAAVTAWVLLGPLLLPALRARWSGGVPWRAALRPFAWRAAPLARWPRCGGWCRWP